MVEVRIVALLMIVAGVAACEPPENRRPAEDAEPMRRATFDVRTLPEDLVLIPDVRIDGHEETLVPFLPRSPMLAVSPNGTLALPQPMDHSVRFFDEEGEPLGSVGREGQGPGEFLSIGSAGWMGDTLWVFDDEQGRVSLFTVDAGYRRSFRLVPGEREVMGPPLVWAMYRNEEMLVAALEATGGPGTVDPLLVRTSGDGKTRRVLAAQKFSTSSVGGWAIPFGPPRLDDASPEGSLVVVGETTVSHDSSTVEVRITTGSGVLTDARTYVFASRPIPEEAADSVLERRSRESPVRRMSAMEMKALRDSIPPAYPPVKRIIVGSDGELWLDLGRSGRDRRYLVTGPDGNPLGVASVPGFVVEVDGDAVWTVERDEMGVSSAARYKWFEPT